MRQVRRELERLHRIVRRLTLVVARVREIKQDQPGLRHVLAVVHAVRRHGRLRVRRRVVQVEVDDDRRLVRDGLGDDELGVVHRAGAPPRVRRRVRGRRVEEVVRDVVLARVQVDAREVERRGFERDVDRPERGCELLCV